MFYIAVIHLELFKKKSVNKDIKLYVTLNGIQKLFTFMHKYLR